jgi:prepilin-type N-terminal cleavage/methylation domain-containing protein
MAAPMNSRRPGFTLTEVLVALTMMAIIGAAATSMLFSQSRFFDQQEKLSGARQVSRSATNLLMSELRMVEAGSGASVLAASTDSITLQVPYAVGLVCGPNAGNTRTVVSMLPVDSATYAVAAGNYSGWARRVGVGGSDTYSYATGTPRSITTATNVAPCFNAGITAVSPGGRVLELQPYVPTALVGAPMFLFQTITYKFGPSTSVPGMRALFRHAVTEGTAPEEIVAPYAETAGFRFYAGTSQTASSTPPGTLDTLRGVEIVLAARSERPGHGGNPDIASVTTAVFFRNRLD